MIVCAAGPKDLGDCHGGGGIGFRYGYHLFGIVIESLGDLLMKPAPHVERGRMDFIVMRYETNCAIFHDIFPIDSNCTLQE